MYFRACHGTFKCVISIVLLPLLEEQNSIFNNKHFVVFLSLQPGLKFMGLELFEDGFQKKKVYAFT